MDYKKLNRIMAAAMFLISAVVYGMTVAPTTSYWDCGEFISSAYILGVPHPPGSPLYVLVGRLFTMLPFPEDIGLRVNIISVIVSAFTVMFTYLVIVRLLREWRGIPQTGEQHLITCVSGAIGALAFAFSDSFWFNAVEAEVYAVSMFFTAFVAWLILLWVEKTETDPKAGDRILLIIAYLVGLATGIHLLNILALPTVFLIIYFKKFEFNLASFSKFLAASLAGFLVIYFGIIQGIPSVIDVSFWLLLALLLTLFGFIYYAINNQQWALSMVLLAIMLVTVGYSTYTALYIRSNLQPAINENSPNVPSRFVSYLNREQYGDIPITERRAPLWEYQIKKMYIRYFGWQFIGKGATLGSDGYIVDTFSLRGLMALPFLVGLIGMMYHFQRDWKRAFSILTLLIMTGVAITMYLNQEDPQPRERDYAYVGSFFAFAIWIGIGATSLLEMVAGAIRAKSPLRKIGIGAMIVLLFVAVPIKMYSFNADEHDRSGNYVAYDYSYNILETCEPNAILFTNGDNDTFPLWFLQYVYGIRTDIRVINLSLLNTDWYIKQLRDEEPKVPIAWNDATIDNLTPQLWKDKKMEIIFPRTRALEKLAKKEDNAVLTPDQIADTTKIEYVLKGTMSSPYGSAIRVQDIMIHHILDANKFRKPVYFAVTVSPQNMLGLDNRRNQELPNFLRMDGLAFQVMPYGGPDEFISHIKLQENLFEKFQYRNLNNPDVFLNYNIKGLLQNYRSAFLRLSNYFQSQSKTDPAYKERAIGVLDHMQEVMPEDVIPFRDARASILFGRLYAESGRPDELEKRIKRAVKSYVLRPEDKLYMLQLYGQYLNKEAKAESLALSFLVEEPGEQSRYVYGWLSSYYADSKQFDKGVDILKRWLDANPQDQFAQSQLARLQVLAASEDSTRTNGATGKQDSSQNVEENP